MLHCYLYMIIKLETWRCWCNGRGHSHGCINGLNTQPWGTPVLSVMEEWGTGEHDQVKNWGENMRRDTGTAQEMSSHCAVKMRTERVWTFTFPFIVVWKWKLFPATLAFHLSHLKVFLFKKWLMMCWCNMCPLILSCVTRMTSQSCSII